MGINNLIEDAKAIKTPAQGRQENRFQERWFEVAVFVADPHYVPTDAEASPVRVLSPSERAINDADRFAAVMRCVLGRRLTFRQLCALGDAGFMGLT